MADTGMADQATLTQREADTTVYYKLELATPAVQDRVNELSEKLGEFKADVGIAAVGPTSSGKSALVNTVASFISNHLELVAGAGQGADDGIAAHVLQYAGESTKWKICEHPGAIIDELICQQHATAVPDDAEGYVSSHEYQRFVEQTVLQPLVVAGVGCIVVLVPATEFSSNSNLQGSTLEPCNDSQILIYLKALKHLHRQAACIGMRMMCMITKVDCYDSNVAEDVAEVATSQSVHMLRSCISRYTGLPLNQVFPTVALVNDINPSDNPALGHLSLFPVLVALRAAANACSTGLIAANVAVDTDPFCSVHMGKQQQQQSPTCSTPTCSNHNTLPISCHQQQLASTDTDTLKRAHLADAVDLGFGRMRGGAVDGASATRSTHASIPDERNRNVEIYINGEFFHRSEAKVSVFDSGFLVGDAIWEGLRLHHGKFAFLDRHLARLHAAAKTTDIPIPSAERITEALYATVERNSMHDSVHARLMITRGDKKTPSQHPANLISGPNVIIIAEHKRADPAAAAGGLTLFTSTIRRPPPDTLDQRLNCHSKLHEVMALIQAVKAGADEALMLDPSGAVATCNATNFFIVTRGTVVTSTGLYNLHGITREMVLEVAAIAGIPTEQRAFSLTDVYSADEAFATGTFGGLTAVAQVDGRSIGTGEIPGPMTVRLQALYTEAVAADVGRGGGDS